MTAPVVCAQTGPYAYKKHLRVLWAEQVALVDAPTPEEMTAAADLATYQLTDVIGWEVERDTIHDPLWTGFEGQRTGRWRVRQAQLRFAADVAGLDIRTLLAANQRGFVLILPSGPWLQVPDAPLHVYPVKVAAVAQQHDLSGGSQLLASFAVTSRPGVDARVASS